jgi:hypothetical protein
MAIQTENPREINYIKINEKAYSKIGRREVAFYFESDKVPETLYVFEEPDLGQTEIISDKTATVKELRVSFAEMVIIPEKEEFISFFKRFYSDELFKFGEAFATALKEKKKK